MPRGNLTQRSEPCRICRARKVKCDRRQGGCVNCERLGFSCSFSTCAEPAVNSPQPIPETRNPDSLDEYTLAGTQRKRTRRACRLCYLQKSRCSGEATCSRCRAQGRECVYPPRSTFKISSFRDSAPSMSEELRYDPRLNITRSEQSRPPAQSLDTSSAQHFTVSARTEELQSSPPSIEKVPITLGLEKHIISHYIDTFFDLVQPNICFFLHRASFITKWNHGGIDICQLKAVCGCAAYFIDGDLGSDSHSSIFMSQVETEVLANIGTISLVQLQNTFLLAYYKFVLHQLGSVWMLFSLCVRSAYAQGLNHENPSLPTLEMETRRRLMWAIFLLDKLISGSLPDLTICTSKSLHLRLPCNDRCFTYGIATKTQYLEHRGELESTQDMGVLAYMLRLFDLRLRIHSCIKPIIAEGTSPWYHRDELSSLERELLDFEKFLPSELRWASENLSLRSYTPSLTNYVMLHSWWYSSLCDLYRCFIPGIRESVSAEAARATPPEYIYSFRQKSLQSAIEHTKLWAMVKNLHIPRPVNDQLLGVHIYHCAQVLFLAKDLMMMQQNDEVILPGFEFLKSWLDIVEELSCFYPMLKDISKDITAKFLGRDGEVLDLRTMNHSEKSARERLLSKYTMVPRLSEDISYSSRRETEAANLSTPLQELVPSTIPDRDRLEVTNSEPISAENLVRHESHATLPDTGSSGAQEWSSLLDGSNTMNEVFVENQDLAWLEGSDLMFFPGFYHGQIDPSIGLTNS